MEFKRQQTLATSRNKKGHRKSLLYNPRNIGGLNLFYFMSYLQSFYLCINLDTLTTLFTHQQIPRNGCLIRNGVHWLSLYFRKYKLCFESICNDKIYDRALLGLDHKFVSFIKSLLYSYNVGEAACATSLASSLEICTINVNRLLLLSKCKNFFGIFGVQSFRLIEIYCPIC